MSVRRISLALCEKYPSRERVELAGGDGVGRVVSGVNQQQGSSQSVCSEYSPLPPSTALIPPNSISLPQPHHQCCQPVRCASLTHTASAAPLTLILVHLFTNGTLMCIYFTSTSIKNFVCSLIFNTCYIVI